jgi:sugar/nucleoside kinase (ribokinase family)
MIPADLAVVGGLTIDQLASGRRAAGGAGRYAIDAALAAGHSVTLLTAAGPENEVADWLDALGSAVPRIVTVTTASIRFEHAGSADDRRLRLLATVPPLPENGLTALPPSRAVLFGPVAGEVSVELLGDGPDTLFRVAGIQGWLRRPDAAGWIESVPLHDLDANLSNALRAMHLLVASERDIGEGLLAPQALAILRVWAGPRPELVITAGAEGAWLQSADEPLIHVPASPLAGTPPTVGAGDAFAANLAALRGSGQSLAESVHGAGRATAHWLGTRPPP